MKSFAVHMLEILVKMFFVENRDGTWHESNFVATQARWILNTKNMHS